MINLHNIELLTPGKRPKKPFTLSRYQRINFNATTEVRQVYLNGKAVVAIDNKSAELWEVPWGLTKYFNKLKKAFTLPILQCPELTGSEKKLPR
jgi:hypothetical protein